MPTFVRSLFGQVVTALVLGVVLGVAAPNFALSLKPLGDGFIRLITMIIGPIVFCVVVHGIAGAGDLKRVGRVGLKAVLYFEALTTLALLIGIVLAYTMKPGVGMNIDPKSLDPAAMAAYTARASELKSGVAEFFMRLIPTTALDPFVKGDVLQVLIFAVLFGCALSMLGERAKPLAGLIDQVGHVLFKMMGFIVRLAPLGVLGAIAFTVAKYGAASLAQLGELVAIFYLSCVVFVLLVLGTVMRLAGLSILKFIAYIREELLIVLGTSSSRPATRSTSTASRST